MPSTFTAVPVLDYAQLQSPDGRVAFLAELRHALVNVGFLYLKNSPVAHEDFDKLIEQIPKLFALPKEKKEELYMTNSEHFLGYTRLGAERTKGAADMREQWDFGTLDKPQWKEGDPEYLRLWGPAQWPEEEDLPGFKDVVDRYLKAVEQLSYTFIELVAEALGLPPDGFARFFAARENTMHRAKARSLSGMDEVSSDQGVGPHFDGGFLTFLLQATNHSGLQVQNPQGEWIDVPPEPYTFVVNIGKALETATRGLARATSHRVLAPAPGTGPRYSVPFFQNISQDLKLADSVLDFPPEVLKLKEERGDFGPIESVNYTEFDKLPTGLVALIGRVKSHPDVAQRHYPDMFKQYFPQGLPAHGEAY
ncbi:Clavaminate synthase-like protein [Peniophora sp. CONT]|nr:Clavaminate synthase-like protein [Peniophora sp. CONT]